MNTIDLLGSITAEPFELVSQPLISREGYDVSDIPGEVIKDAEGKLIKKFFVYSGVGKFLVELFNEWVRVEIPRLINSTVIRKKNESYFTFVHISNLPPYNAPKGNKKLKTVDEIKRMSNTYPDHYRYNSNKDYNFRVVIAVREFDRDGTKIKESNPFELASIPAMLKSDVCNLSGMSDEQLLAVGEDPADPFGIFIVKGKERVVLLNETLRINRSFIFPQKKLVTCTLKAISNEKSKLYTMFIGKHNIKFRLPGTKQITLNKEKSVLFLAVAAFFISDLTTEELGVPENFSSEHILKYMIARITPSSQLRSVFEYLETSFMRFNMIEDVTKYIEDKYDAPLKDKKEKTGDKLLAREIRLKKILENKIEFALNNDLFPHIPYPMDEFGNIDTESSEYALTSIRRAYLCLSMGVKLAQFSTGYRTFDNRDSWASKRLRPASSMMHQLFRTIWIKNIKDIEDTIELNREYGSVEEISKKVMTKDYAKTFRSSFLGPNWGVKSGTYHKKNVAQELKRESRLSILSHVTQIEVETQRHDKQINIRKIQNSQWGFVGIAETPEGASCGINKHAAITARLSTDEEISLIIERIKGYWDIIPRGGIGNSLMINGDFFGFCNAPQVKTLIIQARREGAFRNVSVAIEEGSVQIFTESLRLVRPLLVVEDGELAIHKKNLWGRPFKEILEAGAAEYIDAYEQMFSRVATSVAEWNQIQQDLRLTYERRKAVLAEPESEERTRNLRRIDAALRRMNADQQFTHCEMDPLAIFGYSATLIPYAHTNPGPRNVYQSGMGKQAAAYYHVNFRNRFDTKVKVLASPQRPLVGTITEEVAGFKQSPQGTNVNIAFMMWNGFNQEDAFVFNKASIERRGLFHTIKYWTKRLDVAGSIKSKKSTNVWETLRMPAEATANIEAYRNIIKEGTYEGLPYIGSRMKSGDCILAKERTESESGKDKKIVNTSVFMPNGEEGVVDDVRVIASEDKAETLVLIRFRFYKIPQLGDKFAPRNAQKGTIGLILPEEDMPYDPVSGEIPDIIVNPHCMVSRMTMSFLLEILTGYSALLTGTLTEGTTFRSIDYSNLMHTLREYGFDRFATKFLVDGTTGKRFPGSIFTGPVFFQSLKHHAIDKIQARATGPIKAQNMQPVKGKSNLGGLRFGEMEKDSVISHAAPYTLRAKLFCVSDPYTVAICRKCGIFVSFIETSSNFRCPKCRQETHYRVELPYSFRLFAQYLIGNGVLLKVNIDESEIETKVEVEEDEPENDETIEAAEERIFGEEEEEEEIDFEMLE